MRSFLLASVALCAAAPAFAQQTADPETAAERLSDFQAAFGPNLKLLDAQYLKFIAELR